MSSYREQFFEWVNKQPVYQDMTLQTKEMILTLVNCWLNNNQAYFHYARLNGKGFAKRCAIDFCWFIKNQTIADLQHRLEVAEKALYNLACAVEKESCVYCPIQLGGGERCNANTCKNCKEHKARCELNCLKIIHDGSDGCIDKIVEFYIKQAESELKGE